MGCIKGSLNNGRPFSASRTNIMLALKAWKDQTHPARRIPRWLRLQVHSGRAPSKAILHSVHDCTAAQNQSKGKCTRLARCHAAMHFMKSAAPARAHTHHNQLPLFSSMHQMIKLNSHAALRRNACALSRSYWFRLWKKWEIHKHYLIYLENHFIGSMARCNALRVFSAVENLWAAFGRDPIHVFSVVRSKVMSLEPCMK